MKNPERALALAAVLVVSLAGFFSDAHAATRTWTGAESTLWNNSNNWGGIAPVEGANLIPEDDASARGGDPFRIPPASILGAIR